MSTKKIIAAANKKNYVSFKQLVEKMIEKKFKAKLQEKISDIDLWEAMKGHDADEKFNDKEKDEVVDELGDEAEEQEVDEEEEMDDEDELKEDEDMEEDDDAGLTKKQQKLLPPVLKKAIVKSKNN